MAGYDFDLTDSRKKKKLKKKILHIALFVLEIIAVIAVAFLIIKGTMERTTVPNDSMAPTLKEDTPIMVSRLSYLWSNPKRFDVVVFEQEGDEHDYYYVMRVVGLPGETVQIINGKVYINGEQLKEVVKNLPDMHLSGLATDPVTLDADEYFVLGDNRNKSEDSRFANIGNVTREQIIGKAWLTLDPFNFISKLNLKKK